MTNPFIIAHGPKRVSMTQNDGNLQIDTSIYTKTRVRLICSIENSLVAPTLLMCVDSACLFVPYEQSHRRAQYGTTSMAQYRVDPGNKIKCMRHDDPWNYLNRLHSKCVLRIWVFIVVAAQISISRNYDSHSQFFIATTLFETKLTHFLWSARKILKKYWIGSATTGLNCACLHPKKLGVNTFMHTYCVKSEVRWRYRGFDVMGLKTVGVITFC